MTQKTLLYVYFDPTTTNMRPQLIFFETLNYPETPH